MALYSQNQRGQWDITDDSGGTLLTFNTFLGCEYASEAKSPDQPVEEGGFFSYNKLNTPFNVNVALAISGDSQKLQTFIDALEKLHNSTDLVSVVTPEKTFSSASIVGLNYSRKREDGMGMLTVELKIKEVRQVSTAYTTIQRKSAQHANRGKQQGKETSKSAAKELSDKFF